MKFRALASRQTELAGRSRWVPGILHRMTTPRPFDPYRELERLRQELASQEPAELRRAYIARPEAGRPVWPGTTVPRLGVIPITQTPSGLTVPASAVSGPAPIDAMSVYLTSTNVIGRPLSDAELEQQLKSATDEYFVMEAATWLARLEHHGSLDIDLQLAAAAKMSVEPALTKVQNLIRSGYRLLAPQILLAVIKAALLVSPPGTPARADDNGPNPFTFAMLGVADRLGMQPDESGELWGSYPTDVSLEVARNQSFNADHNFGALLARYQRLWHDLPSQLAGEPGAVDVEGVFEQVTGVALDDLLLVGGPVTGAASQGRVRFERGYYDNVPLPKAKASHGVGLRHRHRLRLGLDLHRDRLRASDTEVARRGHDSRLRPGRREARRKEGQAVGRHDPSPRSRRGEAHRQAKPGVSVGSHRQRHHSRRSTILYGEQIDVLGWPLVQAVSLNRVPSRERKPKLRRDLETYAGNPLLERVH